MAGVTAVGRVLTAVAGWPTRSQQRSRRNALLATTALVQRRRELVEVEESLLDLRRRRERRWDRGLEAGGV